MRGERIPPTEHKEPLPESLERWIREELPKHYREQVEFLRVEGLLELLPDAKAMGIIGIDGKEYPIPLPADIERMLTAHKETAALYARKIDQGFTDLQLTPFGKPLAHLEELLRRSLLQHHKDGKLFSSDGTTILDLDTSDPIYLHKFQGADTKKNSQKSLVYYSERFDPTNHGGKTKQQLLDPSTSSGQTQTEFRGWTTLLLPLDLGIPRKGKGRKVKGRAQLEAGKTPNEYLAILHDTASDNPYAHESGMTPEDWLVRFLKELRTRNRILNDYSNPNDSSNYLLAAYLPAPGSVPYGCWNRDFQRASVGGGDYYWSEFRGTCPAVPIRNF